MQEPTLIPVNISIADRQFRIKVSAADEQVVRESIKTINEKITDYKKAFPGKDMQDYISMALIWFATDYKINGNPAKAGDGAVLEQLKRLEAHIDSCLPPQ